MRRFVLCVIVLLLASCEEVRKDAKTESARENAERTAWFRDAKFGMFVHWGLYAIPARGEWIMHSEKIPVEEYEKLLPQFNPTQFDADEWAALMKQAGVRYLTVTSKHHDGFCMFDSKLTNYTSMHTPAHRDFIADLVNACHRNGIKISFYYSLMDWHHPDYLPRRNWEKRSAEGAELSRYVDYAKGQLRDLCTNCGRIDGIWFDGGWEHKAEEWRSAELIGMIRALQPHILVNNRAMLPADFETPEQFVPATGLKRDGKPVLWETCMTINQHWGYARQDDQHKSVRDLIRILVDVASKGGNLLLNVGPTQTGKIQPEFVARLCGMGAWLKTNGESIYGTEASPFLVLPWGRCTRKGNKLYLHVFDWPEKELVVPGLKNRVASAWLLADRSKLTFEQKGGDVVVHVPHPVPDPIDTVVVLEIEGEPDIDNSLRQAADGSVALPAMFAAVHGQKARYESGHGKDNIGYWVEKSDWVSWDFIVHQPGRFEVEVSFACAKGSGGSEYELSVGEQKLRGTVKETGDWAKFATEKLGTLTVGAGRNTLSVRAATMPHGAVMNLKSLLLKRVGESR